MKRWFNVTSELKVGVAGLLKFENGLLRYTDPAVEFKHKAGHAHGSSIIVTQNSLAFAHMQRITRAGNIWLSGLVNCSFADAKLTPKQLSVCARYHPKGTDFAENTVATLAFDTTNIVNNGDILNHGHVSLSIVNKPMHGLYVGLQASQATGHGGSTLGKRFLIPNANPLLQAGALYKYHHTRFHLTGLLAPLRVKDLSQVRLSVDHFFKAVGIHAIASVGFVPKTNKVKWDAGIMIHVEDFLDL